jgi:hypothetical protein
VYDFNEIHLTLSERFKLFCLRIKKSVSESFLGSDLDYLLSVCFIKSNYLLNTTDAIGCPVPDGTYSLTEKYRRYLIFRREKMFFSVLNSVVTPIVVSVITSVITVLVLRKLGLQS